MVFVQSLHLAGVDAVVNLLPEDVAVWYTQLLSQEYKLGTLQEVAPLLQRGN
jgi:hypothetical protein